MTVHRFGTGFPGVMAFISFAEGMDLEDVSESERLVSLSSAVVASCVETVGRMACHSPSLRATPLQIVSRVRSAGVHTCPCMNL